MSIISYAQNFEDVMLWRALGQIEHGFYIDIGAQDPIIDSVSLAFYEHGWRGIHVEPMSPRSQGHITWKKCYAQLVRILSNADLCENSHEMAGMREPAPKILAARVI